MTNYGAPTAAFTNLSCSQSGRAVLVNEEENVDLCLSYPRVGKHLAFDGHLLHGVPRNLFVEQPTSKVKEEKVRITLLVNVWLCHQPISLSQELPAAVEKIVGKNTMVSKKCKEEKAEFCSVEKVQKSGATLVPLPEVGQSLECDFPDVSQCSNYVSNSCVVFSNLQIGARLKVKKRKLQE